MKLLAITLIAAALATGASAEPRPVPNYGAVAQLPDAKERPEPSRTYKVVFDVSKGEPGSTKPSQGLDRVARYVNMLAEGGVSRQRRQIVVVLHGPATEAVMTDEAFARRHPGAKNPNAQLIAELETAGVDVRVCGQAMAAMKIAPGDVLPGVQIDLAALMTVTHKQFEGYALVVN
uniref:DsrE family protein n=1 Tax=uncultured Caulobacter sp. TaxID=158749 RepID=UPI0025E0E981|nr:DsrE family protein [uncultured Caulobacter sp.]